MKQMEKEAEDEHIPAKRPWISAETIQSRTNSGSEEAETELTETKK